MQEQRVRDCSDFKREGQWETLLLSTAASSKYKDGPKLFLEVQNGNTRSNAPSWNSENSGQLSGKNISCMRMIKSGADCLKSLWKLHPWRSLRFMWTQPWAGPALDSRLDQMTSGSPFQPKLFCNSVNSTSEGNLFQCNYIH